MNFVTKSAVRFRLVMGIMFVVLVLLAGAVAFLGVQLLDTRAEEVSKVVYEANSSEKKLSAIRTLKSEMDSEPEAVKSAEEIVAESKSYRYQNVIVNDIQAMANRAGVEIVNYTFTAADQAAGGSSGATAAPAPVSPAPDAAVDPAGPTPAGPDGMGMTAPAVSTLKSTSFNITLATPVEYKKLLKFIHYIEQNATKMQIATLTLTKGESAGTVGIDSLTIEVYVR